MPIELKEGLTLRLKLHNKHSGTKMGDIVAVVSNITAELYQNTEVSLDIVSFDTDLNTSVLPLLFNPT